MRVMISNGFKVYGFSGSIAALDDSLGDSWVATSGVTSKATITMTISRLRGLITRLRTTLKLTSPQTASTLNP